MWGGVRGFPANAVGGRVPEAATVRSSWGGPIPVGDQWGSEAMVGGQGGLGIDHEGEKGEIPAGSWGVIPQPQARGARVINLTQSGISGASRKLPQEAGPRGRHQVWGQCGCCRRRERDLHLGGEGRGTQALLWTEREPFCTSPSPTRQAP